MCSTWVRYVYNVLLALSQVLKLSIKVSLVPSRNLFGRSLFWEFIVVLDLNFLCILPCIF